MSTYKPEKLLSLWTTEQVDVEMAIGYDLQNSVKLHRAQIITSSDLNKLQTRVNDLETERDVLRKQLEKLQRIIDRLITFTGLNLA